ncbi:MAG: ROK family protein [Candidatus Bathyarchaeota archaeon]|nr:MAG: ROK family protein [Candidatus Bathyarchaeota archaeon]
MPFTLGVDLGGTKVKTALIDFRGQILAVNKHPIHPSKGFEGVIADIIKGIEECLNETRKKAHALGIGIAGQVDWNGVVRHAQNLELENAPLEKILREKLGVPTVVVNDVRAATWGEWRYGSGKGVNDLVVLFVGTGIGGGVITGGNMLEGCSNAGGELGHITIVAKGRKCHCPNMGCLEAYAGGWAIAERAQEAVSFDPKGGLHLTSLADGIENITAATVSQAYREGDSLANQLVEETGEYLAAGIVSIINAFNPCLLVLGGGVIEGLPELVPTVEDFIRKRALESAVENLEVTKAACGDNAGVIGAAALAQSRIG